jgi:hypothetical protein
MAAVEFCAGELGVGVVRSECAVQRLARMR